MGLSGKEPAQAVDLSIIIVNWNTCDLLQDCLNSLPAACQGLSLEVLVVDNDSRDGSAEMVEREFPGHVLMRSGGNLGFSKGNNLALPQARGRYVLLLNPDTVATPGSLSKLVEFAEGQEDLAAVSPLLVDENGDPTITYGYFPAASHHWRGFVDPMRKLNFGGMGRRVVNIPRRDDPSCTTDYIAGACFLIPRLALEKIGLLDERFFMYFEETDWCWRARQAGMKVMYYAGAEVAHLEGRAAARASWFSLRQFQKSYRLFVAKNYGPAQVGKFRLAQWAEYSAKAFWRSLALSNREQNQALATVYRERARLQLMGTIKVTPPS